ncbi:universal stress protein [Natrinema longum]|uniref:Universal stress protein n=1 Tax=Natrinema longum TaxID=370324 RepID=A0A8A2U7K1_9EURY|nr:universal stress protein [Natrinema longum]MBZ6494452.1 universal stress protein [Natrinema longum]QSW84225.1 universal stress protein [Natrinema longum]
MARSLFGTALVPIANEQDADETCRAILREIHDDRPTVHVVHVIEKAGGAPDKAGVEQRRERAARIFERVETQLADEAVSLETEILYGTDVAAAILEHGRRLDATSIVFTPRGANRWMKLLSGDVAQKLLSNTDRPLIVLPRAESHE